jgi:hypothetical protein
MSWLLSGQASAAAAWVDANPHDAIAIDSATPICRAAPRPEARLLA